MDLRVLLFIIKYILYSAAYSENNPSPNKSCKPALPRPFLHKMATSLVRLLSRGITYGLYSLFKPLNYYFRFPCLGASRRSYPVQYASNEPNHDRRWNSVMEKERRRKFLDGRRPPRDCKFLGHISIFFVNPAPIRVRKLTRPQSTLKPRTMGSLQKSLYVLFVHFLSTFILIVLGK